MTTITKGYKVTNADMTCRGFQFEIDKDYEHSGPIKLCGSGFHFCMTSVDVFNYYSFDPNNRVFEVEAFGEVIHGDDKSVTTNIKLIRELEQRGQ